MCEFRGNVSAHDRFLRMPTTWSKKGQAHQIATAWSLCRCTHMLPRGTSVFHRSFPGEVHFGCPSRGGMREVLHFPLQLKDKPSRTATLRKLASGRPIPSQPALTQPASRIGKLRDNPTRGNLSRGNSPRGNLLRGRPPEILQTALPEAALIKASCLGLRMHL